MQLTSALLIMAGVAAARPDAVRITRTPSGGSAKFRRELPQEHSHEKFLTGVKKALELNNPQKIDDPVFALLGNDAAADGAGNVKDLDCLQQIVADQAFTNAKKAGDIEGMTNALMFRAIEHNSAKVGAKSALCTQTAKNPEIAALEAHQDPASDGAAALNKKITLDLAVQLASIGADPQLALESGTFEPGDLDDSTGAGNTCDDENDTEGCIFTQNLLVPDATAAEIKQAVAAAGGSATSASPAAASSAPASNNNANANAANVNAFTGAKGAAAVPITNTPGADKPFGVKGDTFLNAGAAIQRACDVQKNACANAVNSGSASDLSVSDCDAQRQECVDANANTGAARRRVKRGLRSTVSPAATVPVVKGRAVDTGDCGSPAITFGPQSDRAGEEAFAPQDTQSFNHGSASGVDIITGFVCQQLASACEASDAAVQACQEGAAAASGKEGQAAVKAFNSALGV